MAPMDAHGYAYPWECYRVGLYNADVKYLGTLLLQSDIEIWRCGKEIQNLPNPELRGLNLTVQKVSAYFCSGNKPNENISKRIWMEENREGVKTKKEFETDPWSWLMKDGKINDATWDDGNQHSGVAGLYSHEPQR